VGNAVFSDFRSTLLLHYRVGLKLGSFISYLAERTFSRIYYARPDTRFATKWAQSTTASIPGPAPYNFDGHPRGGLRLMLMPVELWYVLHYLQPPGPLNAVITAVWDPLSRCE